MITLTGSRIVLATTQMLNITDVNFLQFGCDSAIKYMKGQRVFAMTLLQKIRNFYQSGIIGDPDTDKVAKSLGKMFECDVVVLNDKGNFWGVYSRHPVACSIIREMFERGIMDVSNMARLNGLNVGNMTASCFNPFCIYNSTKNCPYNGEITYEIPAVAFDQRVGTVIFIRQKKRFSEVEKMVLEMIVITMAFEGLYWKERNNYLQETKKLRVKKFIDSLTISEKKSVDVVIKEMDGLREKIITVSKVADKYGIGRSVFVATLKKLHGAGLVEVASMGVAGTLVSLSDGFEDGLKICLELTASCGSAGRGVDTGRKRR